MGEEYLKWAPGTMAGAKKAQDHWRWRRRDLRAALQCSEWSTGELMFCVSLVAVVNDL